MMNGEAGDGNVPVRRSSRARKPNSRFADDELDGCFKKIVTGLSTPEASSAATSPSPVGRPRKGAKKRESRSEDSLEGEEDRLEKTLDPQADVPSSGGPVEHPSKKDPLDGPELEDHGLVNGLEVDSETEKREICEKNTRGTTRKEDGEEVPVKDVKKRGRRKGKSRSGSGEREDNSQSASEERDPVSVDKGCAERVAGEEQALAEEDSVEYRLGHEVGSDMTPSSGVEGVQGKSGNVSLCGSSDSKPVIENQRKIESAPLSSDERVGSGSVPESIDKKEHTKVNIERTKCDPKENDYLCIEENEKESLVNGDILPEKCPQISSKIHASVGSKHLSCPVDVSHDKVAQCSVNNPDIQDPRLRDSSPSLVGAKEDAKMEVDKESKVAEPKIGKATKAQRGRKRLIHQDSTDSTDSDSSLPSRRRGRSSNQIPKQVLGKGFVGATVPEKKARDTSVMVSEPSGKQSSEAVLNPCESSFSVMDDRLKQDPKEICDEEENRPKAKRGKSSDDEKSKEQDSEVLDPESSSLGSPKSKKRREAVGSSASSQTSEEDDSQKRKRPDETKDVQDAGKKRKRMTEKELEVPKENVPNMVKASGSVNCSPVRVTTENVISSCVADIPLPSLATPQVSAPKKDGAQSLTGAFESDSLGESSKVNKGHNKRTTGTSSGADPKSLVKDIDGSDSGKQQQGKDEKDVSSSECKESSSSTRNDASNSSSKEDARGSKVKSDLNPGYESPKQPKTEDALPRTIAVSRTLRSASNSPSRISKRTKKSEELLRTSSSDSDSKCKEEITNTELYKYSVKGSDSESQSAPADERKMSKGKSTSKEKAENSIEEEVIVKAEEQEDHKTGEDHARTQVSEDKENLAPKAEENAEKNGEEVKVEEVQLTEEELAELERKRQQEQEEKERRNREVVEERLKGFVHLTTNLYIQERKKTKRNKEVRRMVCDCTLTKEEIARGEVGCGEDCLNRLLMIECGSRCPLREYCTNKRFQNLVYGDVEVFNAEEKGCGIRARSPLKAGTFIMEYVGEVLDTKEFKRRRKDYSRGQNPHFYFMALKPDLFIDATRKGNISRFINHSCDPNAETQKWTVNGELRIGFFTNKDIEAGEEINFDYRLERYGREPQKCYCGTSVCRGWLGESPDEKTKEEKDEERRKEERDRRKREEKRIYFEDIALEDEIEKLNSHKLRNREDTLNLSRLMVRAEDFNSRVMLLRLLQTGEPACRRLFLDYHGLRVLWSWMADLGSSHENVELKSEILKTLECLPITNKTQLTDSRVLSVVERWTKQNVDMGTNNSPPPPPPPKADLTSVTQSLETDPNKKTSDTSEDSDTETDSKVISNSVEASSADDSSLDSEEVEQQQLAMKRMEEGTRAEESSSDSNLSDGKENAAGAKEKGKTSAVEPTEGDSAAGEQKPPGEEKETEEVQELKSFAVKLLDTWKNLKEFFRIPKKERIELMKEHEREVDRGYREYLDREQSVDRDWDRDRDRDRDRRDRYNRKDSYYDRRRRSPDRDRDRDRDRDKDRHRRGNRNDRDSREERSSDSPKMSKEQRRQLFALKVQQEEEEAKQRKMQEEMWAMHVDRCRLLGHDPYLTPIFDPTYQYYWDPVAANWQPYNGSDPNIPVPASYGQHKKEGGDGSPMVMGVGGIPGLDSGPLVVVPGKSHPAQPLVGHLAPDGDPATPGQGGPDDPLNPANIPLPGEISILPQTSPSQPMPGQAVPIEGTPPQGAKVLAIPLPGEAPATTASLPVSIDPKNIALPRMAGEEGPPPPPPPGPITIQLPPRWKMARDSEGHVYFYHVKTRTSQWEPPTVEQHQQLEAELGSDSDSDSASSDDSDSTSTSDSEDFSSDEEEEEEEVTVEKSKVSDEKMIRRPRGKKQRSEALVQERVISPILEVDREAARRERREAKERAREEARQERQEERQNRSQKERGEGAEGGSERSSRAERKERGDRSDRTDRHESRSKGREKSKERAASAIADNSEAARKIKDSFRSRMATFIVSVLNPYRRGDCKEGKITCTEDFKYLARKLTHFVMVKELKQLQSIDLLECSESVKHKTKDFVRKYMSKYGATFKRDPNDTKEY
ncbi:histone-lysine N-methyltransferase SETD2-like isoform X2 [Penaeus japonicus]|uniref:histone-lysine N-methyltransferase SETD2-like isoform X2 n=1 Tax=Penaeus japonicus TaxID=27405 RepID=UPI001C714511|nr:histone-lysine N-methyltransferase SETD2-like isoform X2 [Penaeus japonicus]